MDEPVKKRVDESWKEQAEKEKQQVTEKLRGQTPAPAAPAGEQAPEGVTYEDEGPGGPQARFDLYVSSLAMEALIALGDMAHPVTRKQSQNLPQAKYLIDLLGVLEQKTANNLSVDEERLLKDTLYQLRMRYLAKGGA